MSGPDWYVCKTCQRSWMEDGPSECACPQTHCLLPAALVESVVYYLDNGADTDRYAAKLLDRLRHYLDPDKGTK